MTTYSAIHSIVSWSMTQHYIQKENQDQVIQTLCLLFDCHHEETFQLVDVHEAMHYLVNKGYELKHYPVNTTSEMDAFEALIYDYVMPSPQEVKTTFQRLKEEDPERALTYLHQLSVDVNYIKEGRNAHNEHVVTSFKDYDLEFTINLAKPEKDPRDIVHPMDLGEGKPKCLLCKENEQNYFNARKNLRIVPMTLGGSLWHLQYSPYAYYEEHCIVLHDAHIPMFMGHETFVALLDFVDQFPTYFIGSNAGIPIVGGSILNHWHFQGGKYVFPLEKALPKQTFEIEGGQIAILNWPISTIKLTMHSKAQTLKWMNHLYQSWLNYENQALGIIKETTEKHQTITPIVRKINDEYVAYLVLRNNITSDTFPMGVFHSHEDLHHIKKENIGLIEALGLAILPGRLKQELKEAKDYLNEGLVTPSIEKHLPWLNSLNPSSNLKEEVSKRFKRMLEDAAVFKENDEGIQAFKSFVVHSMAFFLKN